MTTRAKTSARRSLEARLQRGRFYARDRSGANADRAGHWRAVGYLRGLAPLAVLLGAWQLLGDVDPPYFPPPSTWWAPFTGLVRDGTVLPALRTTLIAFLLALLLATLAGVVIGAAVGRLTWLDRALGPSLEFCRVMPAAAVLPVFILLFGYTSTMIVLLAVFTSIWPVLLSVRAAAVTRHARLADVSRTLGLSTSRRIFHVLLPALLPAIATGVRVAAPLTLIVTLLAEMLSGLSGLGVALINAQNNFLIPQTYALVAVTGIVGLVITGIVTVLERRVLRRHGLAT